MKHQNLVSNKSRRVKFPLRRESQTDISFRASAFVRANDEGLTHKTLSSLSNRQVTTKG